MIVTSFSPKGYEQYGKRFVETYNKYCNYPLRIYTEEPIDIETKNLFEIPGCSEFLERVKNYKPNHYRNDVSKFCRKMFALYDASQYKGKIAWVDADIIFKKQVSDNFLDKILQDVYVAYLGRKKTHSETGFVALDTSHKLHDLFMTLYIRTLTTGAFMDLKYCCDSDVFDHIKKLLSPPENNLNISGDENHPFVNSILGQYMDHLKGPIRKQRGSSLDNDYIDKRRKQIRAL